MKTARWLLLRLVELTIAASLGVSPSGTRADALCPLGPSDPVFANVTTSSPVSGLNSGEILDAKSIFDYSGNPSISGSAYTLNRVRIKSRECVRVNGTGDIHLNWVWAEAVGFADDHADAVQCFAQGSTGSVTDTHSTFRAHAFATTSAYFSADNYLGDHIFNHVLFWGGPIGLRIHCDGGRYLSLDDVYFVTEEGGYPYLLNYGNCGGAGVIVTQWTNVFNATIVNDALVVGAALPPPCTPLPCRPPNVPAPSSVPGLSDRMLVLLALALLAIELPAIHRSLTAGRT